MQGAGVASAIVLAAGRSERFGEADKQFALLGGIPVLAHSLQVFESCPLIAEIVVVATSAGRTQVEAIANQFSLQKVRAIILGGSLRQDSVVNGLQLQSDLPYVVIHDGARPLVTQEMVESGLRAVLETGACIAAVPAVDTVKLVDDNLHIVETPDRKRVWLAQTPQIFRRDLLISAYKSIRDDGLVVTDDAAAVEHIGGRVRVFPGSYDNIKITTHRDLAVAEMLLHGEYDPQIGEGRPPANLVRTGFGYDVHRFAKGRKLFLGGVEIPHEMGLTGHSDADVILHAIMDAVLGAAALGDIGIYFPPSDPAYKDIRSLELCCRVYDILSAQGWSVVNIDAAVAAERPHLAPYMEEMRARIATSFALEPQQVSIKATTNEGLGFVGREEGLVAWAVANISRREAAA